jgi:hypothetical protein
MNLQQRAQQLKDKRNAHEKEVYTQLVKAGVPPALAARAKAWGREKIFREFNVTLAFDKTPYHS